MTALLRVLRAVSFAALLGPATSPLQAGAEPLTIMVEDASEPFSRPDGTGFANDVVVAAFGREGVEVRLDVVPYARCKSALLKGETPACFSMSWLPEFAGRVRFADRSLFAVEATLFQSKAHRLTAQALRELPPGTRVGVVNGYEYPDSMQALADLGLVLEPGVDERALLQRLARGRIDAAIIMVGPFERPEQRAADASVSNLVEVAFEAGPMQSYIGFSTRHPDAESARGVFNRGYSAISTDGTLEAIRQRWMRKP